MNESNTKQDANRSHEEIDLFELGIRIWHVFKNMLTGIRDLTTGIIIFLIRKSVWMVLFCIAGMFIGFLLHNVSRPYYASSLEGNTGGIYNAEERNYAGGVDNSAVIDHINKLNTVQGKKPLLASNLNISMEDAQNIRSIKAYYGIDVNRDMKHDYVDTKERYNPQDTAQRRVPSFIHVAVTVYDEAVLPVLRNSLLQYINSNAYIQQLFTIQLEQKKELLAELDREIRDIDSLQHVRLRREMRTEEGNLVFLGNEPEMKLFYGDIQALYRQKQALEKDLRVSDEIIVVIHDFTPLQYEEWPVLKYIALCGAVMAVMGLVCAIVWQYRKRIWTLIRS